jgi:molybdate transport system substrate-binding protein
MRRWTRIIAVIIAAPLTTPVLAAAASAAEVVLVTTAAVEQIMKGIIPTFETSTGNAVRMTGSYHPDLVILGPDPLSELAKAGKVDGATITPAFRSRIGFAVRAGAPKPDISTPEGFKKALLDAKSIGYSIGPSGEYFSKVLIQRLGIADALKDKMKNVRGMPIGAGVARGDVEVGIHQIAELMPIAGIDIVGALPEAIQSHPIYATAIATSARQPDAARALSKLLFAERSIPVIKKNGMDPY